MASATMAASVAAMKSPTIRMSLRSPSRNLQARPLRATRTLASFEETADETPKEGCAPGEVDRPNGEWESNDLSRVTTLDGLGRGRNDRHRDVGHETQGEGQPAGDREGRDRSEDEEGQ